MIDGGSTDGTVDILKKYDDWIDYWVSENDRGQSHAINKGLQSSTGEIIGWQNSDDIYYKEAFFEIFQIYIKNSNKNIFTGNIYKISETGKVLWKSKFREPTFKRVLYDGFILATQATLLSFAN